MFRKRIYFDYATTTPLDSRVERAMKPYWSKGFGNAGSLHQEGVDARKTLDSARLKVARILQAHASEIVFTSGGTEGNNMAIMGYVQELCANGTPISAMHAITTEIEHSSVRNCFHELERRGMKVSFVPVGEDGIVKVQDIERLVRKETVLVSVMYANNEIGTIQPIGRIAVLLKKINDSKKEGRISFHTDACQAPLYVDVSQSHLRADFISLDGHKMYGPKGIGMLYVRNGIALASTLYGGEQERGIRPGTEPVPLIVGFAEALSLAAARRKKDSEFIGGLQEYFFSELKRRIPSALINGSVENRLPNNIHISIPGLNAEFAVLQLDARGISCSAKSACLEGGEESYVVKALGRNDGTERSSLRFTLGRSAKTRDINRTISSLRDVLAEQSLS